MTVLLEEKPHIDEINWMCDLSDEFKQALIDRAQYIEKNGGFDFYLIGGEDVSLDYQVSGAVNAYLFNDSYSSKKMLFTHGQWYGMNALFEPKISGQVKINYSGRCRMLRWSQDSIEKLSSAYSEFYKLMFFIQKNRFHHFVQNLVVNNSFAVETRVIYTLIDYGARVKTISGSFPTIEATQQRIAELTGVSRQQVNQVIQPLVDEGVIEIARGKIHIVNPAKLQSKLEQVDLPLTKPTLLD